MRILGIDTATMTGQAAVVDAAGILAEQTAEPDSRHSEQLIPLMQEVIAQAGLTLAAVDGLAVNTGPGSFTGLRTGLAVAKGLAYSLNKPLVGMTGGRALNWQFSDCPGAVCVIFRARQEDVFARVYAGGRPVTPWWNEPLAVLTAWCRDWLGQNKGPLTFVGQAALYRTELLAALPESTVPCAGALRAASVASLGRTLLRRGCGVDPLRLVPFYLRKSEAELQWQKRT